MSIEKPSGQEEEYFARQEFERKKRLAEEQERKLKVEERARLKELHWMRCPKCGMELLEIAHRGIKIDKCTSCAGVWLDAGELEQVAGAEAGFLGGFLKVFKG
jgi:hypothetical protein